MNLVYKYRSITYVILVLLLSALPYYFVIKDPANEDNLWGVFLMFIPLLSAISLTLFTKDSWFKSLGWRINGFGLIIAAVLIPLTIQILTVLLSSLVGLSTLNPRFLTISNGYISITKTALLFGPGPMHWLEFVINYLVSFVVGCLLYVPLAMGEELGWRGYLQKEFFSKYGVFKGVLLLGIIWGYWHLPLILFASHNFPNFPVLGSLFLMPMFTIAFSFIWGMSYKKSNCIWVPVLFHASLNVASSISIHALGDSRFSLGTVLINLGLWIVAAIVYLKLYSIDLT